MGHSVRAKCHHCLDIFIQPLHLSGQIAALFPRDGSGETFHVLQCERGACQSQSWSKKLLEDVGMLVGVKVALKLWLIILKSRIKLEKSSFYKNCSKESSLNYLFYNLSLQMKGWKDNKAVLFEFKFTSYL